MQETAAGMDALRALLGRWKGGGEGDYPTIDSFRYTEELEVICNDVEHLLHFHQRTWVDSTDETEGNPLHWESGFFRPLPGDGIEIVNAQNGERVEVLRGTIERGDGSDVVLRLDSTLLGNDDRMVRTRRVYRVGADRLRYEVFMATTRQAELARHLSAELHRV